MATYLEVEELQKKHQGEVCIFGCGQLGRQEAYDLIKTAGFQVDYYCDNNIASGTIIHDGIKVRELQYLYDNSKDVLVFLCVSLKYQEEMLQQLANHKIKNVVVIDYPYIFQVMESIDLADDAVKQKYHTMYDDIEYLKGRFKRKVGYELNIDNPTTFNEKLQWLKVNTRNPQYTRMVDKYEFKVYVEEVLGKGYTIPTLGIYDSVDEIEWDKLPEQFVLKCTHDSGSIVICKDKNRFDIDTATKKMESGLKRNYYWAGREWPYRNVKPRIIAEEYMQEEGFDTLNVYKVFNFNGNPKLIQVVQDDKTPKETIDYFDTEWNRLNLRQNYPNSEHTLPRPTMLEEMLSLAKKISLKIPFLRTDFYIINDKIYVSEFTFYSDGGMAEFHPKDWDYILGEYIQLPDEK